MRMPRALALAIVVSALCAHDARAVEGQVGSLAISMTGFRSDRGRAMVAVWRDAKDFPSAPAKEALTRSVTIRAGRASARFDDMSVGVFAVTVFHDEDGDEELKENLFGIPKEGVGFSRDVRPRFRAPRFEDAALQLAEGSVTRISIRMLYL
jgi:uncharacterized protein (DUF2141 family)